MGSLHSLLLSGDFLIAGSYPYFHSGVLVLCIYVAIYSVMNTYGNSDRSTYTCCGKSLHSSPETIMMLS